MEPQTQEMSPPESHLDSVSCTFQATEAQLHEPGERNGPGAVKQAISLVSKPAAP